MPKQGRGQRSQATVAPQALIEFQQALSHEVSRAERVAPERWIKFGKFLDRLIRSPDVNRQWSQVLRHARKMGLEGDLLGFKLRHTALWTFDSAEYGRRLCRLTTGEMMAVVDEIGHYESVISTKIALLRGGYPMRLSSVVDDDVANKFIEGLRRLICQYGGEDVPQDEIPWRSLLDLLPTMKDLRALEIAKLVSGARLGIPQPRVQLGNPEATYIVRCINRVLLTHFERSFPTLCAALATVALDAQESVDHDAVKKALKVDREVADAVLDMQLRLAEYIREIELRDEGGLGELFLSERSL